MKKLSKIFAVVLCLALALSMLPFGAAAASNWTEVELSAVQSTDKIAIVSVKGTQAYALLNNENGGSLVSFNAATTAGDATMLWNVVSVSGGYTFKVNGNANAWLYVTTTNDGLKIGNSTTGSVFTASGDLYKANDGADDRNIGVYYDNNGVAKDFRCYKTSNTTSLADQTIKFYKYTGSLTDTREDLPTNSGAIVDAIFKLQKNETLSKYYKYDGDITLTGVVAGSASWNDNYNNGTVNFKVKDSSNADKTMQAYKLVPGTGLTADDVKNLSTGDTVTIKGSVIKNYNGTFEFDGSTLVSVTKGQATLPALPTEKADIVDAIFDLAAGESLDMYYDYESFTLSGTIVGSVSWADDYNNGELTIKVEGTNKELKAFRFKAGTIAVETIKALVAGDKVTFEVESAKNYNGTYELEYPVLKAVEKAGANPGATTATTATNGTQNPDDTGDTGIVSMTAVMALAVTALAALVIGNKKRMF